MLIRRVFGSGGCSRCGIRSKRPHNASATSIKMRYRRGRSLSLLADKHASISTPLEYPCDSLYDDALNIIQASYVSYPLTFLLREAKKGNLQSSDRILEKLWAIGDGDLSTYIIAEDVLDIANNNKEYIREAYGGDFDVDFGWLKSFEHFAKKTRDAGDPEAISMLEFDDHDEHSRLVYGIALNKLRKRITLIFRGTYSATVVKRKGRAGGNVP